VLLIRILPDLFVKMAAHSNTLLLVVVIVCASISLLFLPDPVNCHLKAGPDGHFHAAGAAEAQQVYISLFDGQFLFYSGLFCSFSCPKTA
jgi:hypothetical protein